MMEIIQTVAALFVFSLLVAPIVMMTILLLRTRKQKQNPQQHVKLEELEQNDYTIVDDVNKAFGDVNTALNEISATMESFNKRLEEIEEKFEREDSTIKGFSRK